MAMRLPTFSRVTSLKMRAPAESSVRCTAGFAGLVVEAGLGAGQAVAGQHHLLLDQQTMVPPRST
jgi:hypothetical protein